LPLPPVVNFLGNRFIELQSIDSTNNYALAQIHANLAQSGTCYFAHEQTAGKGQRGKSWATEKGANIIVSIALKPFFLQPFQQFYLSACVAVATHQFLNNYAGSGLKIKWPNDLYWENKKLGGILIENIIRESADDQIKETEQGSNWKWAVIGIGINVNQTNFPPDLKNPVSLKQISRQHFNTIQLAKELCKTIDHFYSELMNHGPDSIFEIYNQVLYKKDEAVKFKKDNRNFEAIVKSVNQTGQLIVLHSIEEKFDFGEVEWVI
jgi:BirA family transcriptional regulator, biotin operon repressor / biotin---[acetyl-CoA-carboxylase] ligase